MRSVLSLFGLGLAIAAMASDRAAAQTQADIDTFVKDAMTVCMEWVKDGSLDRADTSWSLSDATAQERELAQHYPDLPVLTHHYDHPTYNITFMAKRSDGLALRECNIMGLRADFPVSDKAVTLDPPVLQKAFKAWSDTHGPDLGFTHWPEAWEARSDPRSSLPLIAMEACFPESVVTIEGFELIESEEYLPQAWQINVSSIGFEKGDGSAGAEEFLDSARARHCPDRLAAM